MPFIATTKGPSTIPGVGVMLAIDSRLAVATLGDNRPDYHIPGRVTAQGEAWRIAWESYGGKGAADSAERRRDLNAALTLPESGGSVGPLPDGTVIEVEPGPGQQEMRQDLRVWGVSIDTRDALDDTIVVAWVATYNAEQESRS